VLAVDRAHRPSDNNSQASAAGALPSISLFSPNEKKNEILLFQLGIIILKQDGEIYMVSKEEPF
jgi:hypothetical protein